MDYRQATEKKRELDALRPLPSELLQNLEEWLRVELTYTSNAIEGNTLSRKETALVIEKGITIGKKTLIEHLEATNHAKALDFIFSLTSKSPTNFTESDLLKLHEIILHAIDDDNAGKYRRIPVRIAGSPVILPNPRKVYTLMEGFIDWLHKSIKLHPIELATLAHYKLVTIRPFVDGNGRCARLLMNLVLMMKGYPPAIIYKEDRLEYITALETGQLGGSLSLFYEFIEKAVTHSLNLYLKSAKGKLPKPPKKQELLKIGEFANACAVPIPTLRFWLQKGLLKVDQTTQGGFQLFSNAQIKQVEKIKKLKGKRLTLDEIMDLLRQ